MAKQRWIIERDYQEVKQELSLGHYEDVDGATFIITLPYTSRLMNSWWPNGSSFPPQSASIILGLPAPQSPANFRPCGSPRSSRAA